VQPAAATEPLRWSWRALPDEQACFSRIAGFARAATEPLAAADAHDALSNPPLEIPVLYQAHVSAWHERWSESHVSVEGDEQSQRALRFALYHLISAANPDDTYSSVGARGLTGDAYKGHVFWDTEIFVLPFYTFTWPAAARALLMYRYHTLPAARTKAASLGYSGALYAWESADSGEEVTPRFVLGPQHEVIAIRSGTQEQHISADVAYAVWQYWQATGDDEFLLSAGAEILLETSRFWAKRAYRGEDGRFHIDGVIGPDEYHEDVNDNAYTNVMAAFNIECGLKVMRTLDRRWRNRAGELRRILGLADDELAQWRDVQRGLSTGFDRATGLFEQFAGYFALDDIDLAAYAERTAPLDVLLGRERLARTQVVKQADVVMLLNLLAERYDEAVQEANLRYYAPRTGHGSSLSPPAHALAAARLGEVALAKSFFDQTAAIDLDDTMGNAAGGVHIGALGGLWQAAVFGFAGVRSTARGLRLDPHLAPGWEALTFPIQWRQRRLRIACERQSVSATLERGRPCSIFVGSLRLRLARGLTVHCERDPGGEWREVRRGDR
jgi:kojibiose phosphorylase